MRLLRGGVAETARLEPIAHWTLPGQIDISWPGASGTTSESQPGRVSAWRTANKNNRHLATASLPAQRSASHQRKTGVTQ